MKRNNVKAKILKTINSQTDHEWSASEVAAAVKQKPANAAYHLRSLEKDGKIVKVGPGRYKAATGTPKVSPATVVKTPDLDLDAITARVWSELTGTEIDSDTVKTMMRMQRAVIG